ncbi:hypothetical protein ORI89_02745 [Sphingobacterium sp. UT-1RO-CII-1]|uniref:hypothetical protein n=1 Tax=Sphingobacterium sp. UT-1RO-CII-1 TaxID=2995225 RepID=UPI00227AC87B|nr:hypothetical protein [Sphingobacterium sp. UT-1RO-CII-1]MCY4778553.1 hypothetical protein [Sphingobacterium sp. UT-1RO-CII-1]
MNKVDYKLYNTASFREFLKGQLRNTHQNLITLETQLEKMDSLLTSEKSRLTAKTFFHVIKALQLNLKELCDLFFANIPSTRLKKIKRSENRLEDLLGPYFNSKRELVIASGLKETTLNELFDNKFHRIYAYEVYAIAISFGIEPHLLFEYFYGNGKRPIIGSINFLVE